MSPSKGSLFRLIWQVASIGRRAAFFGILILLLVLLASARLSSASTSQESLLANSASAASESSEGINLSWEADTPLALPKDTISFKAQVSNQNSNLLSSVLITAVIPDSLQVDSATASTGTVSRAGNLAILNLDSFQPSQTVEVTITAHVLFDAPSPSTAISTLCFQYDQAHRQCASHDLKIVRLITDVNSPTCECDIP